MKLQILQTESCSFNGSGILAQISCEYGHERSVCITGVVKQAYATFLHTMSEGHIDWSCQAPEYGSMITERYSHSACYHDKSVYIFGGCTSTSTTFNDLWRFDLNKRQWIRPLAIGRCISVLWVTTGLRPQILNNLKTLNNLGALLGLGGYVYMFYIHVFYKQ